jgi:hypothetical protein
MFPYDAALLTAVQAAPQSISDVLQTLQAIGAICADMDGLQWFNWLYLQVTQAVELASPAADSPIPHGWPNSTCNYSDLREAISMEKRYFTSDLSSLS